MPDKRVHPVGCRPKTAFTLIEVLIVLAIITLLAAILFPVFGRVRDSGRRTSCASNLHQLGLALSQYAQDNRSFYPAINSSAYNTGCAPWADTVFPYVKSEQVFECPSFPQGVYKTGCPPNDFSDPNNKLIFDGSYSINLGGGSRSGSFLYGGGGGTSTTPPHPIATTRYTRPSTTILVLDGDGEFVSPMGPTPPTPIIPPATDIATLNKYGVYERHSGGINVAFADGHVKWMSLQSLLKKSLWTINGPE